MQALLPAQVVRFRYVLHPPCGQVQPLDVALSNTVRHSHAIAVPTPNTAATNSQWVFQTSLDVTLLLLLINRNAFRSGDQ
jgi:hypothetical protein